MKFINKTLLSTLLTLSVFLVAPAQADVNPFANHSVSSVVSETDGGASKCGEGKCGENKAKAASKCGEGKCGENKAKAASKCGEGKCGENKAKK